MTLSISYEALYHYRCSDCGKWWSVADIVPTPRITATCPHCGTRHDIPHEMATGRKGVTMRWVADQWIEAESDRHG